MITKENPKLIAPQNCPLCNELQDVIVNGHYPMNAEGLGGEVGFDRERGYAFCNCRNIWFTKWEHINQMVYDGKYVEKYDKPHINALLKEYFYAYGETLDRLVPAGKVLEIGAINMSLLDEFKAVGSYDTYALDIMEHNGGEHKFITGNFEDVKIDQKFDVIWASHIFEHFKDPIAAVNKANNLLNDHGLLFVAMPDPFFIDFNNVKTWQHFHLNEHHIMWDMDSFAQVLEEAGFEIIFKKHNVTADFICIGDMHIMARKK